MRREGEKESGPRDVLGPVSASSLCSTHRRLDVPTEPRPFSPRFSSLASLLSSLRRGPDAAGRFDEIDRRLRTLSHVAGKRTAARCRLRRGKAALSIDITGHRLPLRFQALGGIGETLEAAGSMGTLFENPFFWGHTSPRF